MHTWHYWGPLIEAWIATSTKVVKYTMRDMEWDISNKGRGAKLEIFLSAFPAIWCHSTTRLKLLKDFPLVNLENINWSEFGHSRTNIVVLTADYHLEFFSFFQWMPSLFSLTWLVIVLALHHSHIVLAQPVGTARDHPTKDMTFIKQMLWILEWVELHHM